MNIWKVPKATEQREFYLYRHILQEMIRKMFLPHKIFFLGLCVNISSHSNVSNSYHLFPKIKWKMYWKLEASCENLTSVQNRQKQIILKLLHEM